MTLATRPKVIIIGAGFGGLFAARTLANKPVDVLVVDRHNFHTFTPLLYQVATCALDPSEIAYPVRTIFRRRKNIRCLLGTVTEINTQERFVMIQGGGQLRREPYDYLIVATGSRPAYFGNTSFQEHALELHTLSDAVKLRNHILRLFERAIWTEDPEMCQALTTVVIAGGGPTGLETAGAIYELYNYVLDEEYPHRELNMRVILVEMQPHLLTPYPEKLRRAALEQLQSLGVEVLLERKVEAITAEAVKLDDGTCLPTYTLVWAAGVQASPVARMLAVELAKGDRIPVEPTLQVKGLENVYAIGDIAFLEAPDGQPYPMLIPVAQQQGIRAAKNILAHCQGKPQKPFDYYNRGIMATIGQRRAVAWIYNRIPLRGFIAWLGWLGLHLFTLIGFRNRLNVLINWMWNYLTYDRSVRIILERQEAEPV